ncbi:MAG TPA: AAA family ATPase [Streptosporangiaceae bacterium]
MSARAMFAPSVLSTAAAGSMFPSLRVTLAFVSACGGDPAQWRRRWTATAAQLSTDAQSPDAADPQPEPQAGQGPVVPARLPALPAQLLAAIPARLPAFPAQLLAAVPAQLPAAPAHFVGRSSESARLIALTDPRGASRSASVVITGSLGVGKSAFALAMAHRLTSVYTDGQLYADLGAWRASGQSTSDLLGRFLSALGIPAGQIPVEAQLRAALYRSLLASRRTLVLLDDADSEPEVRPLLAAGSSCLVLVTSRGRLAGLDNVRRIALDELPAPDAQALFAVIVGEHAARNAGAAAQLIGLCGYLPLAIWIAATRLASQGGWAAWQAVRRFQGEVNLLDWLSVGDVSMRARLRSAYNRLGRASRHMFESLACVDGQLDPAELARSLNVDLAETERLLETLVEGGLLQVTQMAPGYRMPMLFAAFAKELQVSVDPAAL